MIRLYGWTGNCDYDTIIANRIGDVNGDGKEDWAIGFPTSNNLAGRVIIMFGKSQAEKLPTSLNVFSVSEDYGIIINGNKAKISFLLL